LLIKHNSQAALEQRKPLRPKRTKKLYQNTDGLEAQVAAISYVAEEAIAITSPTAVRITLNPSICQGKPTIRNTRYTVDLILELLSSGMTTAEILEDYPALEEADIKACLLYAAKLSKVKSVNLAIIT
jgi:uncharacterized protein (DUF433 family)